MQFCVLGDDAALGAFGQYVGDRPLTVYGKPKTQQMPFALGLRPIFEGGAGMQHDVIKKELDVTDLELHVQL